MYTWNKNWILPYESPWGITNKFLYANAIHGFHAAKELTTNRKRVINTYRVNHIQSGIVSNYDVAENKWLTDAESIEEYGINTLAQLFTPFVTIKNSNIFNLLIRNELYYCPECIKYGQHFMFHQFTFIDKCPIHNIDLLHSCNICGNEIPYAIEFKKKIRHFGCKYCGNQLFHNENLDESINYWLNLKPFKLLLGSNNLFDMSFIISNQTKNLTDRDINEYLFEIFTNTKNRITPKHIISKGMPWNDLKFGDIVTLNLSDNRKIEEYVYLYSYKNLSRHIVQTRHLRHKLNRVEEYVRYCCPYQKILSENQIESYYKIINVEALSLYLWKREIECSRNSKHMYCINKRDAYSYKFEPDYSILNYIKKIYNLLPDNIHENFKFSILVHITTTIMYDKFKALLNQMICLYKNNNQFEFTKQVDNLALKKSSECKREFLLTINLEKHIYKIYYEST